MIASDRLGPLALALVCSLVPAFVAPTSARAQDRSSSTAAMAEALFKEGKKLQKEGKVSEACRKFEGSYRIDAALGTLLNLALCHEEEGKTATAWGEFNEALQIAKKAKRADRQKIAQEHIEKLEPLLARFVVTVPTESQVKDLAVEMDGVPLDPGAWGTAIPVDPGEHAVVVKAPKYKPWEGKFKVEATKAATVIVPKLERVPDPKPPDPGGKWKKPVGFAALGVSAVFFGVGGYFGARAISIGSDVATACPTLRCDDATLLEVERGRGAATASNVALALGVLSAGAGAVFLITAPKPPETTTETASFRPFVSLGLGPRGGGMSLGGAW